MWRALFPTVGSWWQSFRDKRGWKTEGAWFAFPRPNINHSHRRGYLHFMSSYSDGKKTLRGKDGTGKWSGEMTLERYDRARWGTLLITCSRRNMIITWLADYQGGKKKRMRLMQLQSLLAENTGPVITWMGPLIPLSRGQQASKSSNCLIISVEIRSHKRHSHREEWKCQKKKEPAVCDCKCLWVAFIARSTG